PIQGEGGVNLPSEGFLNGLRELANEHELLLIFDEVQTGCGRTGHWFAHQFFDVQPDIVTLAKSLCGGIAGGAMLASTEIASSLRPGMHATTFGGNPIAAAAGIAMIETIEEDGLIEHTQEAAQRFSEHLSDLQESCPRVREVRQAGVMIGIELEFPGADVVANCLNEGLLINCTQNNVIRILPAMNISLEQIDAGMQILSEAIIKQAAAT
ncbi:MAG TPA: aspartate aminotransferase family protein, partial [Planctomycetaceae bacterium]|nr:aspartate aminotransferase family protein [Planctomycetaceae bacterium]